MHQDVKISRMDYGIFGIIFSILTFLCAVAAPFVRVSFFFKEADMTFVEYLDVSWRCWRFLFRRLLLKTFSDIFFMVLSDFIALFFWQV